VPASVDIDPVASGAVCSGAVCFGAVCFGAVGTEVLSAGATTGASTFEVTGFCGELRGESGRDGRRAAAPSAPDSVEDDSAGAFFAGAVDRAAAERAGVAGLPGARFGGVDSGIAGPGGATSGVAGSDATGVAAADFGVSALGVTVFGVSALGVTVFGVTVLGVTTVGVGA
jgi:hypothetical protein